MAEITIVAESMEKFMDSGHICVGFSDERQADKFAEFIEAETDKEVFIDQVPLNPENWEQYL